jgi:hypothetical protein
VNGVTWTYRGCYPDNTNQRTLYDGTSSSDHIQVPRDVCFVRLRVWWHRKNAIAETVFEAGYWLGRIRNVRWRAVGTVGVLSMEVSMELTADRFSFQRMRNVVMGRGLLSI